MPTLRWKLRTASMVSLPTRPSVPPVSKRAPSDAAGFPALRPASAYARRPGMPARGAAAHDAIAEMHDGQRIVHGWVIGAYGIKIRAEQNAGPPGTGTKVLQTRWVVETFAIGAGHAGALPSVVGSRCPSPLVRPTAATHNPSAPGAIPAAPDKILRGAGKRVVGLAERLTRPSPS